MPACDDFFSHSINRELMLTTARISSEYVTSYFCNHFSIIIQSHYACKMCSDYPGITLEQALLR